MLSNLHAYAQSQITGNVFISTKDPHAILPNIQGADRKRKMGKESEKEDGKKRAKTSNVNDSMLF